MNYRDFVLGRAQMSDWAYGLSLAATWAWGVSIVVGTQIMQQRGLGAFLIWATANTIALSTFGALARRSRDGIHVGDAWGPRSKGRVVLSILAAVVQWFSLLVNLTALGLGLTMLGLGEHAWPIAAGVVVAYMLWGGFSASVKANIAQYSVWMLVLITAVIAGCKEPIATTPSTPQDLQWACYGALILLAAPFVDQQLWQRRFALGQNPTIKPFVLGSVLFGIYMALVGLSASMEVPQRLIGAVIVLVATSTLNSAISAITCWAGGVRQGRIIAFTACVVAALVVFWEIPIVTLWTAYGTLRLPFAAAVVWKLLRARGGGAR
jgi:Na+/proline symporter